MNIEQDRDIEQTGIERPPLPEERPFPDLYLIDQEAIEKWVTIPENEPVAIHLTRGDLDHLFFSFSAGFRSQASMSQTMVEQSAGDFDRANAFFREARRASNESQNEFRRFFESVMKNAHPISEGK